MTTVIESVHADIPDAQPEEPWYATIERELKPFQKVVRDFIIKNPYVGILLNMGGGKTMTALSALSYIQPPGHILVVAPMNIANLTWPAEVKKWRFPVNTVSLITKENGVKLGRKKRLEIYDSIPTAQPSMYFININLLDDLVQYFGHNWPFYTVIVDESQTVSSLRSKTTQALFSVRPYIGRLTLLTGTPNADRFDGIFSQVALLDYGVSLGGSIDAFHQYWCEPEVITDNQVRKWKVRNEAAEQDVYSRISHIVMSAVNTDIKLPPLSYIDHSVELDEDELKDYKNFKKEAVLTALLALAEDNAAEQAKLDAQAEKDALAQQHTTQAPVIHSPSPTINPSIPDNVLAAIASTSKNKAIAPVTTEEILIYDQLPPQRQDDLGALVVISAEHAATLRLKLLQFAGGGVYVDPENSIDAQDLNEEEAHAAIEATRTAMTTITTRPTMIVHLHKVRKVIEILTNEHVGRGQVSLSHDPHDPARTLYTPEPTIIAYRFVSDKEILLHYLKQAGIVGVEVFDGSPEVLDRWNAGRIPVLLLQPASAGHGLNFQHGGRRLVWYNLPDRNEHYMQANARLHRIGQQHPVDIHRIITKDTFDAAMPGILAGKADRQQKLIDAVRRDPV